MLKNWIAAGAIAGALGLIGTTPNAQAMPVDSRMGNGDARLTLVSGGCGPYWHRGPYGGCRPGGQWDFPPGRGPIRPIFGPNGGRWCPPGYHLGQYGGACWPF